ncbi:MAG: LamG domain-containing protein, partial [Caldilineaceae bacterium]|nr:LamG domain-containing protein [Caldilineaceae bacterium]
LTGVQQILAAQQTSSPGGVSFGLNGDKLQLQTIGAQDFVTAGAAGLTAGAWNHVAVLYNVTDNVASFYVNGVLLETVTGSTELVVNTDDDYRIGEGFNGAIDEVVVYATTLNDETLYDINHPLPTATSLVKIRYRHASGVVWPHLDPDGLALYLPLDDQVGSEEFEDLSTHGRDAVCADDHCPSAYTNQPDQPVDTGVTPVFDGVDDYLLVPHVLDPAATDLSASLWFRVSDFTNEPKILQQTDGSGAAGRTWFGIWANGTFFTYLGGKALNHPTAVKANTWHHAAVTYDHKTQLLTLYLDGVPVTDTRPVESSDGDLVIGAHKTFGNNVKGFIDEIAIFDRALTATEVGFLAQSPWYDASDIYYWLDDGNRLRDWSHTVPAGLEGPYKIDLQVADGEVPFHRKGVSHAVWTGEIDTTAPRVALTYTLSVDKSSVTIACAAADYNLSEEGWACPVDDANRSHHNKDAAWFTTIFSGTTKLAGFTTAEEIFTPGANLHVTACDLW